MSISFLRRAALAAITTSLLVGVTTGGALASPAGGQADPTASGRYQLVCADGGCTLRTASDNVSPLTRMAAQAASAVLPGLQRGSAEDVAVTVGDDLALSLPLGQITLPRTDLTLTLNEDKSIQQINGVAQMPFPNLGGWGGVDILTPATARVGLDNGANLAYLNAPLLANRTYLYFDFGAPADGADAEDGSIMVVPAGQRATLVVDTQEPLVYLAGNVTISDPGEIALAGPWLEAAQRSPLIPDALPLRERTGVAITGQFAPQRDTSFLQLGGAYGVEAGLPGFWSKMSARPLTVQGWTRISGEGLLVNGVAGADLVAGTLFDGDLGVEGWIPFDRDQQDAYIQVSVAAAVPVVNLAAETATRVSLPLDVEGYARLTTGATQREVTWHPSVELPDVAAGGQKAGSAAMAWLGTAVQDAGEGISTGSRWLSSSATSGLAGVKSWLPLPGGKE